MKSQVSLFRVEAYDNEKVLAGMRKCLEPLGGMEQFVKPGQKVLLKPNVLGGFHAEKAVTTHPSIVRAAALLIQEVGGQVMVGDSPGIADTLSSLKKSGIHAAMEEAGATLADFKHKEMFHAPNNRVGKQVELARAVAEADVVISLPKLKTHVQFYYTGAVKNQFGLVLGKEKARYHYRYKNDEWLAELFLDINRIAKPSLAIMDAIYGMEGNGPSGGEPRKIGALIASADLSAIDVVACSIINADLKNVVTIQLAGKTSFGASSLEEVECVGDPWRSFFVKDFKKITHKQGIFILPLPEKWQHWIRERWAPKPRINMTKCIHCGACHRGCPVEPAAIDPESADKQVDDKRCIRCYCCHEFCPEKAIDLSRWR